MSTDEEKSNCSTDNSTIKNNQSNSLSGTFAEKKTNVLYPVAADNVERTRPRMFTHILGHWRYPEQPSVRWGVEFEFKDKFPPTGTYVLGGPEELGMVLNIEGTHMSAIEGTVELINHFPEARLEGVIRLQTSSIYRPHQAVLNFDIREGSEGSAASGRIWGRLIEQGTDQEREVDTDDVEWWPIPKTMTVVQANGQDPRVFSRMSWMLYLHLNGEAPSGEYLVGGPGGLYITFTTESEEVQFPVSEGLLVLTNHFPEKRIEGRLRFTTEDRFTTWPVFELNVTFDIEG